MVSAIANIFRVPACSEGGETKRSRSPDSDRHCRHRLRQKISGEIIDECPQLWGLVSACGPHRAHDLDTIDVFLDDVDERAFLDLSPRAKKWYTSDADT